MRKVFVTTTINLVINLDDGIAVDSILSDLCVSTSEFGADIESCDVTNYEITDSK